LGPEHPGKKFPTLEQFLRYETRFNFETFGRLLRSTYPDGEIVTNTYDSGGNLTHAEGVKAGSANGQKYTYRYLRTSTTTSSSSAPSSNGVPFTTMTKGRSLKYAGNSTGGQIIYPGIVACKDRCITNNG
jgi:YD repeat-containing protein